MPSLSPQPAPAAPKLLCVGLLLQPFLKDPALEVQPGLASSYPHTNAKISGHWVQGRREGGEGTLKEQLVVSFHPSPGRCYLSPERDLLLQRQSDLQKHGFWYVVERQTSLHLFGTEVVFSYLIYNEVRYSCTWSFLV